MTSEFRIDRPGVYRRRDGTEVCLWPRLCTSEWWNGEDANEPAAGDTYRTDGRLIHSHKTHLDIVAYVSPLPADILQRMREALAMAEEQSKLTYEQRGKYACDVCGNVPDGEGFIQHGRGCYVVNEDGGGITLVDFDEEAKQ